MSAHIRLAVNRPLPSRHEWTTCRGDLCIRLALRAVTGTIIRLVMMGTMVAVASAAIAACRMPAWRATRFDPIAAWRND